MADDAKPAEPLEAPSGPPADHHKYAILAHAAYTRNKPVDGYDIDPAFSDRNRTTYVDKATGKAIIAFRGTQLSGDGGTGNRWTDLGADSLIALGLQDLSKRFQGSRRVTKQVMARYGKDNVALTGHSLGGSQALYVHHRINSHLETHAFNPGISPVDVERSRGLFGPEHVASLFNKAPKFGKMAHTYITRGDLISSLAPHVRGLQVHRMPTKVKRNPHAIRNFLP
jgi:hypothetical protein